MPHIDTQSSTPTPTHPEQDTTKETKTQDESYSKKFIQFAKREQKLRAERDLLSKEKAEISELRDKIKAFEDAKARAKLNPKAYLEHADLSLDDVQEFFLNGGQATASNLEAELRKEIEDLRRSMEEREVKQQETSLQQREVEYKDGLKSFISSTNADFLKAHDNPHELVYSMMREYYDETSRILQPQEAVDLIEEQLEKQFEDRYGKLDKVRSKFAQQSPQQQQQLVAQEQYAPRRTLSQNMATGQTRSTPPTTMSEQDRLAAAATQLKWVR
jgi:hypothetical protein